MRKINEEELKRMLENRVPGEMLDLSRSSFENMDLSGWNLQDINFDACDFRRINFDGTNLSGIRARNALFGEMILPDDSKKKTSLSGANLQNAILESADFRGCDLHKADIRCEKAKVLTIDSIDGKENYTEAHSYVDENFYYRVGQMVYARNFNPDRFVDSGGGIHVWLSREEAIAYLG